MVSLELRFTANQLCKLSGLNQQRVEDWTYCGALVPIAEKVTHRGKKRTTRHARFYDVKAALAVWLGASLLRAGVRGEAVDKAVRFLQRARIADRVAEGWRLLCMSGDRVWNARGDATFATLDPQGAVLVSVDLQTLGVAFEQHLVNYLKANGVKDLREFNPPGVDERGDKEDAGEASVPPRGQPRERIPTQPA